VGAPLSLRLPEGAPYRALVGVGGIGWGLFFALEGGHDLGRNESRPARLLDVRDYCKLHIVAHYPAVLLGASAEGAPFRVVPVGKVGADEPGRRLVGEMAAAGMDVRFVDAVTEGPTQLSVCLQYPDGSGGNVTTSVSAASTLSADDVDRAAALLDARAIALAAPEAPLAARVRLLERASEKGALRVAAIASVEAAEARRLGLFERVDLLALNEDEAAAVSGASYDRRDPRLLLDAVAAVVTKAQARAMILVTVGADGAYAFVDGDWTGVPALDVPVASTAGAGDALLGGVLTGLALGLPLAVPGPRPGSLRERPLASALDLGACVAAYKVTSPHTIPPGFDLRVLRSFAEAQGLVFGGPLRAAVEPAEGA
jgi:sugar/nucleoside kinase (ribokinase family)